MATSLGAPKKAAAPVAVATKQSTPIGAPKKAAAPVAAAPAKKSSVGSSYSGVAKSPSYSPPAAYSAPASSGGGGGGGGGGASDFIAAPIAPAGPAMETITIPDAMSDPAYQEQAAQLSRNLADFDAQQRLADNQYSGSYDAAARKLGRQGDKWDPNMSNGQYGQSLTANDNDFAARGMYNSGQLIQSHANIDSDFNSRLNDMDRARGDFRDTAALSRNNMQNSQEVVRQQALASAVASLAAKYGINSDQVPRGNNTTITREKV